MPRKRRKKKPPWFEDVRRIFDEASNALMEMDMRGELADSPDGVVRVGNRWQAGKRSSKPGRGGKHA